MSFFGLGEQQPVFVLLLLCWTALLHLRTSAALQHKNSMNGTVYYSAATDSYAIKLGVIDCAAGIACGFFEDTINETGWGNLEIATKQSSTSAGADMQRMYAAGFLEGYLTSTQIYNSWLAGWQCNVDNFGKYEDQIANWTQQQSVWIQDQIRTNAAADPYWQYMSGVAHQYQGLKDGYNYAVAQLPAAMHLQPLTQDFVWQFLNGNAEFFDLVTYFEVFGAHAFRASTDYANLASVSDGGGADWVYYKYKLHQSRCSVLIKVLPELEDLYFAHSTWSDYCWMNRIMKRYILELEMTTSATEVLMSSYPGSLSSIDDYYIMNNGMAVTETTNLMYNDSLYSVLVPQSLFVWQRVLVANMLASNGKDWVGMFSRYNSGTYNNQWMALNYGIFQPGKQLPAHLLWIAEQIPGDMHSRDVTAVLEHGYWGSYNVPAIEYVYKITGNAEMAAKDGVYMSYDLAPRARIFRRDANGANTFKAVEAFMRYNNYHNDPIEHESPAWAIMSRFDLNASNPQAFGGMDSKVANLTMLQKVECRAQNGPTHDNLPAFAFAAEFADYPHQGLPTTIDFEWVHFKGKHL